MNSELERFKSEIKKKNAETHAELKKRNAELRSLDAKLQKLKEREVDLQDSRRAMLYLLEDLHESYANVEKAKREWEATFDAISDPIFIHDNEFMIVRANRAYRETANMSFKDILGKPYYEIFPKMDGPFKMCRKTIEGEIEEEEEISLPEIDKIYRVRYYPIKEAERYVYSVHILEDITEQKKAEQRIKQEMEITSRLLMIAEATAHTTDIDKLMEQVTYSGHRIIGCNVCLSYLWDKEMNAFSPCQFYGLANETVPLFRTEALDENVELVKKTLEKRKPVIAASPETITWLKDIQTMTVIPLIGRTGYLGLLIGIYTKPREFTDRDRQLMEGISHQVSIALEEARLYKDSIDRAMELSHKIATIQVMHEIDKNILSILDPHEVLEIAARMTTKVIPCDGVTIVLADKERQKFKYAAGFGVSSVGKGTLMPFNNTSSIEVIKTGRPQYVANLEEMKDLLSVEKNLLEEGFLSLIRVPLRVKREEIGTLNIGAKRPSAFNLEDLSTLEKIASQIAVAMENARLFTDIQEMFLGIIKALSESIDAKSPWTRGHSERVTDYAITIGREMGLDSKTLDDLKIAGLLHDIGKLGIYDDILDKPGELSEEEYEIVKKHPRRGANILRPIKQLRHIIPWIEHHHECYDGTGYPDGLKGGEIPLMARILTVADVSDSMMAERPYRKTLGKEKALGELKRGSGSQFDPKVVEAFLRAKTKDYQLHL